MNLPSKIADQFEDDELPSVEVDSAKESDIILSSKATCCNICQRGNLVWVFLIEVFFSFSQFSSINQMIKS